jgi:hypothetical protein
MNESGFFKRGGDGPSSSSGSGEGGGGDSFCTCGKTEAEALTCGHINCPTRNRQPAYIQRAESINHPAHYGGDTTYEAIKVIEAWGLGFCLGNSVKYISRAGKKEGSPPIEDLKKALWYLQREITNLEKRKS